MHHQFLVFLSAAFIGCCFWTIPVDSSEGFLETDRSYKYDLLPEKKNDAESNCKGKCVHVFMGLLCDFVDEQADCGEQYLRCCVGGIFSRSSNARLGVPGVMGDGPADESQQNEKQVTTQSPSSDAHPVADPPPKEPGPTPPATDTPIKLSRDPNNVPENTTYSAMESLQSPQIESTLVKLEESSGAPCPGSCVMPLLGLLCGTINRNYSCDGGKICCTVSTSAESDDVETTTANPIFALTSRTPITRSSCLGRCIPMYLSNTCKRPNVIIISKKVTCSSGMICCSMGLNSEDKEEYHKAPTETEHDPDPDTEVSSPDYVSNSKGHYLVPLGNDRPQRHPFQPSRKPMPSQLRPATTHGYHRPARPMQKPLNRPPTLKPPIDSVTSYNYYNAGSDEDESSQDQGFTRRPPYNFIRHPSLGPPVIPTPPYHKEENSSMLLNEPWKAPYKENEYGYPGNHRETFLNLSASTRHGTRPQRPNMGPPALETKVPVSAAVTEAFPLRNARPPPNIKEGGENWAHRVGEHHRPLLVQSAAPLSLHDNENKRRKPNWQHSRKPVPQETELAGSWVMPAETDRERTSPHFSAATASSGWIPFHQAHHPVDKQKVVDNHYNSEFQPMRGAFQISNAEPRDPNVCGVKGAKTRNSASVSGSKESRPGEWCWHAAIVNRKNQYLCNGALIGAQWVLTNADCVLNHTDLTDNIYVRLGYTDIVSPYNPAGAQTKTVAKAYIHHSFQKDTLANNIALLKLKDIVDINDAVCVICLPHRHMNSTEESRPGRDNCVVTGYGRSVREDDITYKYYHLKEANVPILEDSECHALYPRARQLNLDLEITGSSFCAGEGSVQDDCRGDPGRLLACPYNDYYQVSGIASRGLDCGGPDALAEYVNISAYSGWINQVANINRY